MKLALHHLGGSALAEIAGKAAVIAVFSWAAVNKLVAIHALINDWSRPDLAARWLHIAAHVCILAFLLFVVATTFRRHQSLKTAQGFEPLMSALAGTFLSGTLGLLPPAEMPVSFTMFAVGLSAVGGFVSASVLLWLGRSFSITAQARRLVTSGPYAWVRHPLYLAEELMVLGTVLLVLSPAAILIAAIHWLFQLRRMINEEKVLRAVYADYNSYAAKTPRVIPSFAVHL